MITDTKRLAKRINDLKPDDDFSLEEQSIMHIVLGNVLAVIAREEADEKAEAGLETDAITMELVLHKVSDELPARSGEYICIMPEGRMTTLMYSDRHKLFNAADSYSSELAEEYAITSVQYWALRPCLPLK